MNLILALIDRWWATRFHPMAKTGLHTMVEGARQGQQVRTVWGFGLLLGGTVFRARPRQRIYSATLEEGEAVGIRLIRRGEVIGEFEIPDRVG